MREYHNDLDRNRMVAAITLAAWEPTADRTLVLRTELGALAARVGALGRETQACRLIQRRLEAFDQSQGREAVVLAITMWTSLRVMLGLQSARKRREALAAMIASFG